MKPPISTTKTIILINLFFILKIPILIISTHSNSAFSFVINENQQNSIPPTPPPLPQFQQQQQQLQSQPSPTPLQMVTFNPLPPQSSLSPLQSSLKVEATREELEGIVHVLNQNHHPASPPVTL